MESHAHRLAKRLLLSWLRKTAEAAGLDGHADFCGLTWRVNRPGPAWGVWEEYPILFGGLGIEPVWDETDQRWGSRPPSYDEVVAMGWRPASVLDIAIQHKGRIAFALEIRHKHACDPRKIGLLSPEASLLEIPAAWVLGQVDRPQQLPAEFWLP